MLEFSSIVESDSVESWLIETFQLSKSQIKKHLSSKNYLKKHVRKKDVLSVPINLVNYLKINPSYDGEKVEILYEENNFLALSKPTNIHCHPLSYQEKDNLLSYLRENNKDKFLEVNSERYDRSLLYRLDFETSGVVILTSNKESYSKIRNDFKSIMKHKEYLALCVGDFDQEGEQQHFFKPSGIKGSKQIVSDEKIDKSLSGSLKVIKLSYNKEENVSLVKVHLTSGLRHQIRAQLAYLGFPILGDMLYGSRSAKRLFLHAYIYEFEFNGKKNEFKDDRLNLFDSFFDLNSLL